MTPITDSEKLQMLANWFDVNRPGEGDEVQQDLRRIASEIESIRKQLEEKDAKIIDLTGGYNRGYFVGIKEAQEKQASEFKELLKRCEDLEAENQQLKLKVVEDAVRFAMYMSGKSTIGDQDYFKRSFEAGYYKTWKINN